MLKIHKSIYKPGHYYSSVPDVKNIKNIRDLYQFNAWESINLNDSQQFQLLAELSTYQNENDYLKHSNILYTPKNTFFVQGDAYILNSIIRHFCPQNIIEIGSGFSSAVIIDTNNLYFNSSIHCVFVEPYPEERLFKLIEKDKYQNIYINEIQQVDKNVFNLLQNNDILFIDSSHVSKFGSDVNYLIFNILPTLQMGVIIHFHDICFPFEYPIEWINEGRFWNEAYILRAFLMYNTKFEIILFNNYLFSQHNKLVINTFPLLSNAFGGSIWLRKIS